MKSALKLTGATRPNDALAGYVHSGFFVMRTPALSVDTFRTWSDGLEAEGVVNDSGDLEGAWQRDVGILGERLRAVMSTPACREALFVASPDLAGQVRPWLDDRDTACPERLLRAVVRYFVRMAGRCTPFGLCATTSIGTIAGSTSLNVAPLTEAWRRTRLDMEYVSRLVEGLASDPRLRDSLVFRINSSLLRLTDQVRHAEVRRMGRERRYELAVTECDEPLAAVLEAAANGTTRPRLIASLVGPEVEPDEAGAYVDELIAAGILESDLEPTLTGGDALSQLVGRLEETDVDPGWLGALKETSQELTSLDTAGPGVDTSRYVKVAERLAPLPAEVEPRHLFQVDVMRPGSGSVLPESILAELGCAAGALLRLTADRIGWEREALDSFRKDFMERYGEREIPILEALDEEIGIGFQRSRVPGSEGSPLLAGLGFPDTVKTADSPWTLALRTIVGPLGRALQSGATYIDLSQVDLAELPEPDPDLLPDALDVTFTIQAVDSAAIQRGEYRLSFGHLSGPSGARVLGRFCHMSDELERLVRCHLRAEEQLAPDQIFAELVHWPQGRTGNVLARPVLREFEIPFLGRSGAAPEFQIPLQDLFVSIRAARIVLRSARLDREVIPRLTTAHNFGHGALGVYHFLCRLQSHDCLSGVSWHWGPLENLPFLPGVRIGRVQVSPPLWRIDGSEIREMAGQHGLARFRSVQRFRESRRLPRWIGVMEGDNVLPVDLSNALSADTFIDLIAERSSTTVRLLEWADGDLPACGPEGHFVHELIVPLVRKSPGVFARAAAKMYRGQQHLPTRHLRLGPSSRWIYAKIYTGEAAADAILANEVSELVEWGRRSGTVDRWFFVRYSDPEFHLRLRLRATGDRAGTEIRREIDGRLDPLLRSDRVWRIQYDTYDPEIVRYGGEHGLDLSEQLFQLDSEAAVAILSLSEPGRASDDRWRLCLAGMDGWLSDLGCDRDLKLRLLVGLSSEFNREFHVEGDFRHRIRDRFRRERSFLEALIDPGGVPPVGLAGRLAVLEERGRKMAPLLDRLRAASSTGLVHHPVERLAESYLHMHANRMLRASWRAQEMLLYHFLERLYQSQVARRRSSAPAA